MPELNADQIKQAYGGYAGWNDPAAIIADFRATGGAGKGGPGVSLSTAGGVSGGNGRQSAADIYSQLESQTELPTLKSTAKSLQEQIYKIEDYLNKVEGDVQQRSGDFLMNEAQQRRLIASESEPSQKNLTTLSTNLARTSASISQITSDITNRLNLTLKDREYVQNLQSAAAEAGVGISGDETPEELLTKIAEKAAETTNWERSYKEKTLAKQGSGTQSDRETAAAEKQLLADARNGVTFGDLILRYSGQIPDYRIRALYNSINYYGKAATETEADVAKIKNSIKPTSGFGGVNGLGNSLNIELPSIQK